MKSQKNHVDVRGYEEWDINGKCKRRVPIETYKVGRGTPMNTIGLVELLKKKAFRNIR
jgi:hypothetical protein